MKGAPGYGLGVWVCLFVLIGVRRFLSLSFQITLNQFGTGTRIDIYIYVFMYLIYIYILYEHEIFLSLVPMYMFLIP